MRILGVIIVFSPYLHLNKVTKIRKKGGILELRDGYFRTISGDISN